MKCNVIFAFLGLLAGSLPLFAQVNPIIAIEWQRSFGGLGFESGCRVRPVAATGYVVAGTSGSSSNLVGNKTSALYGSYDLWSIGLDPAGEIRWQRSDGGTQLELSYAMVVLPNGDMLHAGTSDSYTDGNKTNANNGLLVDPWLVRIDANGNKLWDRTVGTTRLDLEPSVGLTSDGGFIFGAQPIPRSPNKPDFMVWRLAANGTQIWNRAYGGTGDDLLTTVQQTSDGGYVLGGDSNSGVSGNKTEPSAGYDFWLLRIDAEGTVLWDRTFGGDAEDRLRHVRQTADGGFILAGTSKSTASGNKTSPSFGSNDFWFVRVDTNGIKLWDRAHGGTGDEVLGGFDLLSDGGVIAGGYSSSEANGSKTAPSLGAWDGWLIRLDADGNRVWDQSLGGSNMDAINTVQQTPDGGFIIGADSLSLPDGNKTTPVFGEADFWVIKLGSEKPHLHWERDGGTQWRLVLRGLPNQTYHVEGSSNLVDWVTVRTSQLDAAGRSILESLIDGSPQRYFRARD